MGAGWGSFAGDNNQHAAAVVTAIHNKEKKDQATNGGLAGDNAARFACNSN